jgi:hypothetical protein
MFARKWALGLPGSELTSAYVVLRHNAGIVSRGAVDLFSQLCQQCSWPDFRWVRRSVAALEVNSTGADGH